MIARRPRHRLTKLQIAEGWREGNVKVPLGPLGPLGPGEYRDAQWRHIGLGLDREQIMVWYEPVEDNWGWCRWGRRDYPHPTPFAAGHARTRALAVRAALLALRRRA